MLFKNNFFPDYLHSSWHSEVSWRQSENLLFPLLSFTMEFIEFYFEKITFLYFFLQPKTLINHMLCNVIKKEECHFRDIISRNENGFVIFGPFCAFVKRILRSSSVASDLIVRCVEIETVSWHPSKTINHENVCIFQSSYRTTSKITDGVARWRIVKRLILEFSARRWDTYVQNVGVRSPGGTICSIIWSTLVDNCRDSTVPIALTGLNTRRTLGPMCVGSIRIEKSTLSIWWVFSTERSVRLKCYA